MIQPFRETDAVEAKVTAVPDQAFSAIDTAQDEFFAGAHTCEALILGLYDAGRLSFSDRIGRDYFLNFFTKLIENAETIGTFETIILILKEIFGQDTEIFFDVPAPGKLEIDIASYDDLLYDLVGNDSDGEYHLATDEGDELIASQLLGIETEAELVNLLSEIVFAGVFFTPSINFFTRYSFVADEDSELHDVVDDDGNQILFIEAGG